MARSVAKFGGERRRGLARPTGASPARNSRRGPNTSPSRPETGWATALVRWNSEIIQETQANNSSKSSASWIRATAISEELSGFSTVPEAVATSRGPRRGPARPRDPAPEPPPTGATVEPPPPPAPAGNGKSVEGAQSPGPTRVPSPVAPEDGTRQLRE